MSDSGKGTVSVFGTRNPGGTAAEVVSRLASFISRLGYTIRTGGADGVDTAAMRGTVGRLELMLPWATYNEALIGKIADSNQDLHVTVYNAMRHPLWTKSVFDLHPKGKTLPRGPFALHARNYGIVDGSRLGLAFPNYIGNPNGGGTSQGIRVAKALNVPLIESPIGYAWDFDSVLQQALESLGEPEALSAWKDWNEAK
jgi:hypothetical protein